MAAYGKMTEFNSEAESWVAYSERLSAYFEANDITIREQKRAILISVVGSRTYGLLRSLVSPAKPSDKSFSELIKVLENHFDPKPSAIIQRFKFNTCSRRPDQSIAAYVAELRSIAEHCEYEGEVENMLRDRLVCGVSDDRIQRRLLSEPDLKYQKALEIAQGIESASRNITDIQHASRFQKGESVHHVSNSFRGRKPQDNKQFHKGGKKFGQKSETSNTSNGDKSGDKHCYRCGSVDHAPDKCKFRDEMCRYCHLKGHILKMCRRRNRSRHHQANVVDEECVDFCSSEYELYHVGEHDPSVLPYFVTMEMNDASVQLQIDTGATFTLMTKSHYDKVWSSNPPVIQKTSRVLRSYTGEKLKMVGAIDVDIKYGDQPVQSSILIVDENRPSLLGRDLINKLKLDWSEIATKPEICEVIQPVTLEQTLEKHADVLSGGIGEIKGAYATIHVDPQAKPKFYKARPVPYALKKKVDEELDRLLSDGIIEPVQFSEWATPIVPVLKGNGNIRICGDYKTTVNQVSTLDQYPIPKIDDIYAELSGGQTFTKIDLASAYLQLPLDETSKKYTTINTHRGLFRYNRLPFGISSSPGIFQRYIDNLLKGAPMSCGYQDDIIISGKDNSDHVQNVDTVLGKLSTAGIHANKEKCVFQAKEVTYLGHRISAEGLHPVLSKVEAISSAPSPTNVSELKSYLGLLNYYGKFLPNLSTVLAPLHKLLRKDVKWQWGREQNEAFCKSKELLNSSQLLVHYDASKDLVLATDASQYGLGAVLSHVMEDGTQRPISFASRTLNPAERNYSQIEKEALSVIFGIKKFHSYLYGRRFHISNDHKPLETLFSEKKGVPATASGRIQRWSLTLSAYDYSFRYTPGNKMNHADAMSRLPLPDQPASVPIPQETIAVVNFLDATPVSAADIERWTQKDPTLSRVKRFITHGWTQSKEPELQPYQTRQTELSVQGGIILWGARVVVPPQGQQKVLNMLHDGHPGIVRMKMLARSYVWWPKLDFDIESKVRECDSCQINSKATASVPMHPWEYPQNPWTRIHIDYAGPFQNKMFLLIVDAHSKWLDVHVCNSSTSQVTIDMLEKTFATHGLPVTMVSDNGTAFTSSEFKQFVSTRGIEHVFTPPYHPGSNGMAERCVQTFKEAMKKMNDSSLSVESKVSKFLFRYRSTPHTTTGKSPAEIMFSRKMRTPPDLCHPDERSRVNKAQQKQKLQHDGHSRDKTISVGDAVYITNFGRGSPWIPGIVVVKSNKSLCEVRRSDGRLMRRHLDHVKRRYAEETVSPPVDLPYPLISDTPVSISDDKVDIPTSTPSPSVSPSPSATVNPSQPLLRRSTRSVKPPVRLDL